MSLEGGMDKSGTTVFPNRTQDVRPMVSINPNKSILPTNVSDSDT